MPAASSRVPAVEKMSAAKPLTEEQLLKQRQKEERRLAFVS